METFWFIWLRFRRAYDSAYDTDFWFSLGHKRSYYSAYDYDSDSVAYDSAYDSDSDSVAYDSAYDSDSDSVASEDQPHLYRFTVDKNCQENSWQL